MYSQEERVNIALGMIQAAYSDYIAARVLLNKNHTLQGVILASTAIEKYFKALIIAHSGKIIPVHFDKFDRIKQAVEEMGYSVLIEKMDPRFIDILTKAYPLRYYDNIKSPTSIGFFRNQFLGELDQAIYWFDQALILSNDKGAIISPLKLDFQENNPDLLENNWVTQNPIDKKRFMETDCEGFAIYIHPQYFFHGVKISSEKGMIPYDVNLQPVP
jgi:HEPN domain-containing protein